MNAPATFFERRAIAAAHPPFPIGFLDEEDNPVIVIDQHHQSHVDARVLGSYPAAASRPTENGRAAARAAVSAARAASKKFTTVSPAPDNTERQKFIGLTSWSGTPEKYRKILAQLASLPSDTAHKSDRELTENEKVLLRAAVKDLLFGIGALAGSI